MLGWAYRLLLLVTILAIAVVLIAPSVDLPDTTLNGIQNAANLLLALVLVNGILSRTIMLQLGWREKDSPCARLAVSLRPWLCVFLC
jgi:hypothetical protein